MSKNDNSKVSIIIPVYNGENYLRAAIDSAIAQTYSNIEIIVVDDGSTDSTASIAATYGDKIKFFSKPNGGCGSALNFGIAKMTGDYFSWLSHDDVYLPNKVELQVKSHQEQQDKNVIIYSSFSIIDGKSNFVRSVCIDKHIPPEKRDLPLYALSHGLIHGCALLIPVVHFFAVGLFDEALRYTQDYDLFFKLFHHAPVHFCNHTLVMVREHPAQDSCRSNKAKSGDRRDECNRLWSTFLDSLTDAEMAQMEKTPYAFLRGMVRFLSKTDYDAAISHAQRMAEEKLANTKISVIMPLFNDIPGALLAMNSVMTQTHRNFELIVVNDGATVDVSQVLEKISSDKRIKYISIPNSGYDAAISAGAKIATGHYMVFFGTNQRLSPESLATHLRCKEEDLLQEL
ncbi:MAG: glycosyltransferase [Alphaproteobacteria bacterium]|nr:glycosyltransferase [Alphaproteobacteria bacterium]